MGNALYPADLQPISLKDSREINGGLIDPVTFFTVAAGITAIVTLVDYAAKEIQTGYEIYQKTH